MRFDWVCLGFNGFYWYLLVSEWVLLCLTGFDWVSLDLNGF